MRFHIITIFPDIFDSYLKESIVGRAIKNKHISVRFYNPRDYVKSQNKANYKPVDDRPYGGGPGMVMKAEPLLKAVAKALNLSKGKNKKVLIINFVPSAEKFTTSFAKKVSKKYTDIILICGRYEGIDARVDKILSAKGGSAFGGKFEKISIGDYILTGGELPAMILVDCISRQIHGVLGKYESLEENRISSSEVYTRPEVIRYPPPGRGKKGKNYKVPKILLSGHQAKIEEWKKKHIKKL